MRSMSSSVSSSAGFTCAMPALAIMTPRDPRASTVAWIKVSTSARLETSAVMPMALRCFWVFISWTTSEMRDWFAGMSLMQMSKPSSASRRAIALPLVKGIVSMGLAKVLSWNVGKYSHMPRLDPVTIAVLGSSFSLLAIVQKAIGECLLWLVGLQIPFSPSWVEMIMFIGLRGDE